MAGAASACEAAAPRLNSRRQQWGKSAAAPLQQDYWTREPRDRTRVPFDETPDSGRATRGLFQPLGRRLAGRPRGRTPRLAPPRRSAQTAGPAAALTAGGRDLLLLPVTTEMRWRKVRTTEHRAVSLRRRKRRTRGTCRSSPDRRCRSPPPRCIGRRGEGGQEYRSRCNSPLHQRCRRSRTDRCGSTMHGRRVPCNNADFISLLSRVYSGAFALCRHHVHFLEKIFLVQHFAKVIRYG